MILTPHILAGAVVAAKISNPVIGLPLAFLSHFLLDALPHREYSIAGLTRPKSKNFAKSAAKVLIDLSFGLGLTVFAATEQINILYLAGAIILAVLPDFFQLLTLYYSDGRFRISQAKGERALFGCLNSRWLEKFNRWHCDIIHLKYPLAAKSHAGKPKIRRLADWGWIFQIAFSAGLFIVLTWR